jgi:hypothetical protein
LEVGCLGKRSVWLMLLIAVEDSWFSRTVRKRATEFTAYIVKYADLDRIVNVNQIN